MLHTNVVDQRVHVVDTNDSNPTPTPPVSISPTGQGRWLRHRNLGSLTLRRDQIVTHFWWKKLVCTQQAQITSN